VIFKLEDAIIFMFNFAIEIIQTSIMKTKKVQILKEVVRDVLIVLGLAMVVVAPIAFVLFMMWVQQIICG
jgi:hypothetical protein